MTIQPQNNNLNYLIDPTFTNVNRLFVLLFAGNVLGDNRDFNVLIDGKSFFDLPVKNEEEAYEKIIERAIIMTTQLVIYWILLISKNVTD